MTRDRDEWPLESPRHVFDKASFAAASRAFKNYRQARGVSSFKQLDLTGDWQVERFLRDSIFFYGLFRHLFTGFSLGFLIIDLTSGDFRFRT